MNLTKNEKAMLETFYNESIDCCGSCDELENMSWCNASDLKEVLGWNKQAIGGVMSSLLDKGLIVDSGDSARGLPINDFVLTDDGIKEVEAFLEEAEEEAKVKEEAEPEVEDRRPNLRQWCVDFKQGVYNSADRKTQIDAGWFDWFCTDKSLSRRLQGMAPKVMRISKSEKINTQGTYVIFKNTQKSTGELYDDFRICEFGSDGVMYTVSCENVDGKRVNEVWGQENNFDEPLVSGGMKDVYKFFGV